MYREELILELDNLLRGYLIGQGVDLIDLVYRYESRGLVLRLLVDKPEGGINLGECALLNREIGRMFDEKNVIQDRYVLEVSSPGLDRPLKTKQDFSRCLTRTVRLFFKEAVAGKMEVEGVLLEVKEDALVMETDAGIVEVLMDKIARGKQIID